MRILPILFLYAIVLLFPQKSPDTFQKSIPQSSFIEAKQKLKKALERNPQLQGPLLFNLGHMHMAVQQWDSAQYYLEQSLPLVDKAWASQARNTLGYLLSKEGKLNLAIKQFRQALSLNPENTPARFNYELAFHLLETTPDLPNKERSINRFLPPGRASRLSHRGNGEYARNTYLKDSLTKEEIDRLFRQVSDREKSFVQQLRRSPRKFLLSEDKPNW